MAQKSKLLRLAVQLNDTERHCYETLSVSLAQHPSETTERLLARLVAFGLEYEPGLAFGGGISTAGEAPIWLRDELNERVKHWIELGQPDEERLEKLVRRVDRLSLYLYGAQALRWWQQHGSSMKGVEAMKVVLLEWAVLESLARQLEGGAEFSLTRAGDQLYLGLGAQTAEMDLILLAPGWGRDY